MANIVPVVRLFLLLLVVVCDGDDCPRQCKCIIKKKMYKVSCQNKDMKDITQDAFPQKMEIL